MKLNLVPRRRPTSIAAAAVGAALLFAACSGGGSKTTSKTVPATGAPSHNVATGVGEVDQLVNAALDGNTIRMAALTGYQKLACTKDAAAPGTPPPPACRDTETEGQEVEVLPKTSCQNEWVRPEQVSDTYTAALGSEPSFYEAYVPKPPSPATFGGGFRAQYVVVMQTKTSDGSPSGMAMHILDGRIVWLETQCTSFQQFASPDLVQTYIVAPEGGAATATP